MRIRRTIQLALIAGLLSSLAFAAPAAAARRYLTMPSQTLRPDIGQYTVTFSSTWDVYKGQDAGQTWWFVTGPEVTSQIVNGWACVNGGTCKHTWLEAKIYFTRANGTTYSTVLLIGNNMCWTAYGSSNPTYRAARCSTYQLPLSVTGIIWSARLHTSSDWGIDRVTPWSSKSIAIGG